MTQKQLGVMGLVATAGAVLVGISTVARGPGMTNPSGTGASHAVGAFVPAAIILAVTIWLFMQKPKARKRD